MSLSKLLKTPHAELVNDKGEPMKPTEAWTPSVVENGDGTTNLTTVRNLNEDNNPSKFEELLRSEGFDPAEHMVAPNGVQVKNWEALRRVWVEDDSERGGHHETEKTPMRGFKLTIIKRPYGAVDVDELAELVSSKGEVPNVRRGGLPVTYMFAAGDQQWSKADGDGLKGQVGRHKEVTLKSVEEATSNPKVTDILIAFTGDACELFSSQGGKNAWRTTLTVTEQLRLMRRMYLWTIDQFIDAGFKNIKVVAVPSNHGRMHDTMVKTRVDDNYDVDGLVAVADSMELNPERYGGVQCYVPRADEQHVSLEVNGLNISVMHGDAWRPGQHWKFWEGQAFGQTDIGKSRVLLCGHGHHLHIEERDVRTFIMTPALEEVSSWWKQKTGTTGHPGAVSAIISDGEIEMIHKIHATYRGESTYGH